MVVFRVLLRVALFPALLLFWTVVETGDWLRFGIPRQIRSARYARERKRAYAALPPDERAQIEVWRASSREAILDGSFFNCPDSPWDRR